MDEAKFGTFEEWLTNASAIMIYRPFFLLANTLDEGLWFCARAFVSVVRYEQDRILKGNDKLGLRTYEHRTFEIVRLAYSVRVSDNVSSKAVLK